MCFNKKLKKQIGDLEKTVKELQDTIINQELKRLREESKDRKELLEDLKNIHLKVKNVSCFEDDNGRVFMKVVYDVPTILMPVQDNGKPARNEFFRSVNRLNLLSQNDTEKIYKVLKEIENIQNV